MSQKLCRIRDKQGVNFTLAVYSRKKKGGLEDFG